MQISQICNILQHNVNLHKSLDTSVALLHQYDEYNERFCHCDGDKTHPLAPSR
ncbi:hypothetical protein [Helicobacter sp. T3_23-1059]